MTYPLNCNKRKAGIVDVFQYHIVGGQLWCQWIMEGYGIFSKLFWGGIK